MLEKDRVWVLKDAKSLAHQINHAELLPGLLLNCPKHPSCFSLPLRLNTNRENRTTCCFLLAVRPYCVSLCLFVHRLTYCQTSFNDRNKGQFAAICYTQVQQFACSQLPATHTCVQTHTKTNTHIRINWSCEINNKQKKLLKKTKTKQEGMS